METPDGVFQDCCCRFGWLKQDVVESLIDEATDRGLSPLQLAIEDGLLDATKVDIIRTLAGQTEPIPGYEIEDVLGMGGMGVVYRARQVNLNRSVALKTVLKSCLQHAEAIERFEQEAMVLGQLQHPHIISAIDFGKQANRIYFVMELVTGEDLGKLLNRETNHFDEWGAWELIKQTAQGLTYAAQHGIVHRDIKPANLILVPDKTRASDFSYHVKIADFGLARLAEQATDEGLTQDGVILGSPRYMAPEQVENSSVTPAADVYALGATAYHIFAGVQPFDRLHIAELIRHKVSKGPTALRAIRTGLTPETYQLVEQLLEIDPTLRPSASDVVHQVEKLQRQLQSSSTLTLDSTDLGMDETVVAPLSTVIEGVEATEQIDSRQPRHSSRYKLGIGVLLVAALATALWWAFPDRQPQIPIRQELVPSERTLPLFNGQQLGGWKPLSGNWLVPPNEPVISGTNGVLQHVFLKRGPNGNPQAVENYRLELIFECREAEEIHFLLAVNRAGDAAIDVEIDEDSLKIVDRDHLEIDPAKPHALTVEHQAGGWFVDLDGKQVGVWPKQPAELPEVRIQVIGGPAWFSDIYFTELRRDPT